MHRVHLHQLGEAPAPPENALACVVHRTPGPLLPSHQFSAARQPTRRGSKF